MFGGEWKPADCVATYRMAVIIPFRDRDFNLKALLHHLIPLLQKQFIHFRIFVVEQVMSISSEYLFTLTVVNTCVMDLTLCLHNTKKLFTVIVRCPLHKLVADLAANPGWGPGQRQACKGPRIFRFATFCCSRIEIETTGGRGPAGVLGLLKNFAYFFA